MGSPFSHCAVLGAECLSSLYPRPLNGNLKSLAELTLPRRMRVPPRANHHIKRGLGEPALTLADD